MSVTKKKEKKITFILTAPLPQRVKVEHGKPKPLAFKTCPALKAPNGRSSCASCFASSAATRELTLPHAAVFAVSESMRINAKWIARAEALFVLLSDVTAGGRREATEASGTSADSRVARSIWFEPIRKSNVMVKQS